MIVLGIESTCDETACAIVREGKEILSHVVFSQTAVHKPFNGVFPELACRQHIDAIIPVVKMALDQAGIKPSEINLVAAAKGPGLIGALLIGLNAAKALAYGWNVPFIGVNHVEAHLYAAMMPLNQVPFPSMGLVISGGHTFIVKIEGLGRYIPLATTRDDAVGEAFDKVAVLLGLPYPGGPEIEKLALSGDAKRFAFKPGRVKTHPLDFSFSGLKTGVLYTVKELGSLSFQDKADIAASFQETALLDLVHKATQASIQEGCSTLFCGGGVSNNNRLKKLFQSHSPLTVHYPPAALTVDNAAMIAGLGFHSYTAQGHSDPLDLCPSTRIPLA